MSGYSTVIILIELIRAIKDVLTSALQPTESTHKRLSLLSFIRILPNQKTEVEACVEKLGMVRASILENHKDDVQDCDIFSADLGESEIRCFIDEYFRFNKVFKTAIGTLYYFDDSSPKLERLSKYFNSLNLVRNKMKEIQVKVKYRDIRCWNLTEIEDILKPGSLATYFLPFATGIGLLQVVVHDVDILNGENTPISDELLDHLDRIVDKIKTAFYEVGNCIEKLNLKDYPFRKENKAFWYLDNVQQKSSKMFLVAEFCRRVVNFLHVMYQSVINRIDMIRDDNIH